MGSDRETIVCFCEDVTEDEITDAIRLGMTRPVDIKNHLRPGMGPCQGRGCASQVMKLISRMTGQAPEEVFPLSDRPPIRPVPIGVLSKIRRQGGQRR